MRDLVHRYKDTLSTNDPVAREVARRQLERLTTRSAGRSRAVARPSRWAHVGLGELFAAYGNQLRRRPDGKIQTGHEPLHSSRSGRCVVIDETFGRWWC